MFVQVIAFIICIFLLGLILKEINSIVNAENELSELKRNNSINKNRLVKSIKSVKKDIDAITMHNVRPFNIDQKNHGVLLRKKVNLNSLETQFSEMVMIEKSTIKELHEQEIESSLAILFYAFIAILTIAIATGDIRLLFMI